MGDCRVQNAFLTMGAFGWRQNLESVSSVLRLTSRDNHTRLHEAIGYVTPDDEHQGRGETIRATRTQGMRDADQKRRAWHRSQP